MKLKHIVSNLLLLCLISLVGCSAESFQDEDISLQNLHEGDLMFVVKETSNPITDATQGINGLKIDHVAIFHHTDSADYALEAYGKAVSLTPLTKFLDRTKGKEGKPLIAVGRVIVDCDMATSMNRALSYLGRPYDHFYMPDDKEIYCSELVQKSFVDHHGLPVFPTIPMSFHDKDGKILDAWVHFYAFYHREIPEGEPGTNPGQLSRDKAVKVTYEFQTPSAK